MKINSKELVLSTALLGLPWLGSILAPMLVPLLAQAETDVSHNWNAENEVAAMKVFRDKYEALGGVWKETTFPDSAPSLASVKTRFIGGKPPMAVQGALGGITQDFGEGGLLADLQPQAESGKWAEVLPAGMVEAAQYDGKFGAVPVFIDVINWLYTNNEVLAAAGVEPPTTFEDFMSSLDKIKASGATPIAVGGQDWQETILFDHMVLAAGGVDFYNALMSADADAASSDTLLSALQAMAVLRGYTDEGKAGRSWNDTALLPASGKAAYFFMGPWAAGAFADLGAEGEKWTCRLTPWSSGLLAVADGFLFINTGNADDASAQAMLATALMDPQTQVAAAKAKGTIPAIKGANAADFEGCTAKAVELMQTSNAVTHWNGRSEAFKGALKDTITNYWNSEMSAEQGRQALQDALANL